MKALISSLAVLSLAVMLPVPTQAAVVNVDFEQPADQTHSGADGILSGSGTSWNRVLYNADASNLTDESSAPTAFQMAYLENGTPNGAFVNLGALNSLQDTGVLCQGFEIRNLVPETEYTLAFYGGANFSFSLQHATGFSNGACTGFAFNSSLPGLAGTDYCLLSGLVPIELSPGVYGLRISGVSGPLLGIQIEGSTAVVEPPPVDETAPICWVSGNSDEPPRSLMVSAQDPESGMASVNVLAATNAEVTVPTFEAGSLEVLLIEIAQTDAETGSMVRLELLDRDGNGAVHEFEISGNPADPEPAGCDDLLAFFDESVAAGTLVGNGHGNSGKGRMGAMHHMLLDVCALVHDGMIEKACGQLAAAQKKCDGDDKDFVTGPASPELAARIAALRSELCSSGDDGTTPTGDRSRLASLSGGSEIPISWGVLKAIYDDGR